MLNFKGKGYVVDNDKLIETKANIEKIKNKIISLQNSASSTNIGDNFAKATKSLKKFGLALFSVSGIYRIISKASSSYLSTDSQTTSQIESNWVALGTILEPVIKYITNLLKKAVTSILYFISQLTGTDYIAKANANALKKQADATNQLTKANDKAVASFDELNIASSNSSGSGSSSDSIVSLFDINDISESARSAIEKIATALKPVYDIVKDIIGWALDNPETIFAILGGLSLLSFLGKVIGVAGAGGIAGTGLAGVLGLLLAIASIGVITISINKVITEIHKLNEEQEGAKKNLDGVNESQEDWNDTMTQTSLKAGKTADEIEKLTNSTKVNSKAGLDDIKVLKEQRKSYNHLDNDVNELHRRYDALYNSGERNEQQMRVGIETVYKSILAYDNMYRQNELNSDQLDDYIDLMMDFISTVGDSGTSVDDLTKAFGLNEEEAEDLQRKYLVVSKLLTVVSQDTELSSNKFDFLTKVMKLVPEKVKTQVLDNAEEETDKFYQLRAGIINLPVTKYFKWLTNSDETEKDINKIDQSIKNLPTTKTLTYNLTVDEQGFKDKINNVFSNMSTALSWVGIKMPTIKLATGGIVNNPGHGVPLGSGAIGGEVRKEGVIPLTDSQAMEELGSTIGRYITVNLTNINKMDSRTISRETRKVQNDIDFATNR